VDEREVIVAAGDAALPGTLALPERALGVVVFAHGSGSGRFSPRNRLVAGHLNSLGLATLLFDLLTRVESEIDAHNATLRFDIELLSRRLIAALDWLSAQDPVEIPAACRRWGLFGASTGAAGALVAAAARPAQVAAVVSRGGRPDLAGSGLNRVRAPTLLIVGGDDVEVLRLNERAARQLASHRLAVVPGATHLFEEPGKLEEAARLAGAWFVDHLRR